MPKNQNTLESVTPCPYCGATNPVDCAIRKEMLNQSRNGGHPTLNAPLHSGGTGPFWRQDNWNRYTKRATDAATANNCLRGETSIRRTAGQLTRGKEERNEFDDN